MDNLPKFDDTVTFVLNFNGPDSYFFHALKFSASLTLADFIRMRRSAWVEDFSIDGDVAYATLEFSNRDHAEEFWTEYVALMEKV